MPLAGELIQRYLRLVRVHIDAAGETLEEALLQVPEDHRSEVRLLWQEQNAQVIRPARMLSGRGGPRDWSLGYDPSGGYYWRRLRTYLLDHVGRSEGELRSLDDSSDQVLRQLEHPGERGPAQFRVQGLVVGYIQSGKTANFSALIAKAADLGYKFILVLSGIHNTLRLQTQRRLAREFGLFGQGVGEPDFGRRWISLTKDELGGDFREGTIDANVLQGTSQVMAVVKKNATVLRRLTQWMSNHAPPDLPVLVIDDEADQASINTGGNRPPLEEYVDLDAGDVDRPEDSEEISPSVINGLVRQLLRSFGRVSYVAYTATPFANVLINHMSLDRDVEQDLYPRDFIVSLPRLPGYIGVDELFGRDALTGEEEEAEPLDVIRMVPDEDIDALIPGHGAVDDYEPTLPESLRLALLDFLLSTAARLNRDGDQPATMLIHTHPRTLVQNRLAESVADYLGRLRNRWRYDKGAARQEFEQRWDGEFRPLTRALDASLEVEFSGIETALDTLLSTPVPVLVLNSTSDHVLDYEREPNLKAVLIGGNRLSRGLTLEGLLVSYYVRPSLYFDTLLQMGRWFGYRRGYVDLTRIWTTAQLAGWFRDLALAEEELRRQIVRYERERLTPLDFGLKIRSHPVMLVTAENKMGSARVIEQNYSGSLLQTITFRLSNLAWLEGNLSATRSFLRGLGPANAGGGQPTWSGVDWRQVDAFLEQYQGDPRATVVDVGSIRQYLCRQADQAELTQWWVSVCLAGVGHDTEDLGVVGNPTLPTIFRTRLRNAEDSIGTLVNPARRTHPGAGDEEIGLTTEQLERAAGLVTSDDLRYGEALRQVRDRREGLLLIYPISRFSTPTAARLKSRRPLFDDPERGRTVIGVAIAFPDSDSAATIEYVVGSVDLARASVS